MTDYTLHCEGGDYSMKFHLDKDLARALVEVYDYLSPLCLTAGERIDIISQRFHCTEDDVRDALTMQHTNQLD